MIAWGRPRHGQRLHVMRWGEGWSTTCNHYRGPMMFTYDIPGQKWLIEPAVRYPAQPRRRLELLVDTDTFTPLPVCAACLRIERHNHNRIEQMMSEAGA